MDKYSKDWTLENGVIKHDAGKFYEVIKGVHGNPVIFQKVGGKVYLTLVGDKVLCEKETVYEDGITPTQQLRVVRASIDNPDHPNLLGDYVYLGEGYANTQRILGAVDKFYLVRLAENPDLNKYCLLSKREVAQGKDNFGKAALLMLQYYEG